MTVSFSCGWTPKRYASVLVPRNITASSAAIPSACSRAFFDSGFLNAWTPFEIASTPVRAEQPFENAPRIKNTSVPAERNPRQV